jgi:hypothetical protein
VIHLCFISGGLSSFEAARRTVQRYGPDHVELWFADTKSEDPDLYRFLNDCERYLDVPIRRFSDGRNLWDLFDSEGMIGNSGADLCSRILKRELLNSERARRFPNPDEVICVFGFDWTEPHRQERVSQSHKPYACTFPLNDPPHMIKCELAGFVQSIGITPPRLTMMGFPHNNCGGFCVKAGQAHFALLMRTLPRTYGYHEERERQFRSIVGKNVSVLRDRRNGRTTPLTLEEFRLRLQNQPLAFEGDDWGGCGCFVGQDQE